MKPDSELLPVLYAPGVREDLSEIAPPGTLTVAQNIRYGTQRIFPRPPARAVDPFTAGTTYEITGTKTPGFVSRVGNANLLGVDGRIFARDYSGGTFEAQGAYSTCLPQSKTTFPGGAGRSFGSSRSGVACNGFGYVLRASPLYPSNTVYWVIESPNGTHVGSGQESAEKCACLAVGGDTFIVVTQSGVTLTATIIQIANGQMAILNHVVVGTLATAASFWDASAYDLNRWLLVWQSAAAVMTLGCFGPAAVIQFSITFAVPANAVPSVWGDTAAGRAWVGDADPSGAGASRYRAFTVGASSFTLVVGPTTIATSILYGPPLFGKGEPGTGPFFVIATTRKSVSPFTRGFLFGWLTSAGALEVTPFETRYHAFPISKPDSQGRFWAMTQSFAGNWRAQRHVLLRCRHTDPTLGPAFLTRSCIIELATAETVAPVAASDLQSHYNDYFHAIAEADENGGSSHYYPLPFVLQQGPGVDALFSVDVVRYQPASVQPFRETEEFGSYTAVAGQPVCMQGFGTGLTERGGAAASQEFTGSYELGFPYRPAVISAAQVGGSLTATGVYEWRFVFEWVDPQGQRHRSAPSEPFRLTLTGANTGVTFQVTSLDIWDQKAMVSVLGPSLVSYRTIAGGTDFHREALGVNSLGTAGLVTFTSSNSDANILATELLYTDGADAGIIGNAMPPACSYMCRTGERLILGGGFERRILTASKIIIPGEPIQFSASAVFQIALPEDATALAFQDGTIYAFARDAIYAIGGEGPADNGVGQFTPPTAILRDLGCLDNRSILETSAGVFFQSDRGMYLLPRGGGTPQFLGIGLETTMAMYRHVRGGMYVATSRNRLARFIVSTERYIGGVQKVLVFDFETTAWSIDTYDRALQCCGTWSAERTKVAGPVFALANLSDPEICAYWEQDEEGLPSVDGTSTNPEPYSAVLETAQIRPWGICGWGSLHDVIALMSGALGAPQSHTIVLTQDDVDGLLVALTLTPGPGARYAQVTPQSTRCSAFKLRHVLTTASDIIAVNWHGFQVSSVADGERRTPSAERFV